MFQWLVPGCVAGHGVASILLAAAMPERPAATGVYAMKEARALGVPSLRAWIARCDDGAPLCEEMQAA